MALIWRWLTFCLLLAVPRSAAVADPLPQPPPVGTWAAFPNSALRPAMTPFPPDGNPASIFDYSGGWWDEDRQELGVWGGGHGDYPGNEVCTFPVATGRWTCTPRSAYVIDPTTDALADGKPAARHTYASLARVNAIAYDGFFVHGGSPCRPVRSGASLITVRPRSSRGPPMIPSATASSSWPRTSAPPSISSRRRGSGRLQTAAAGAPSRGARAIL